MSDELFPPPEPTVPDGVSFITPVSGITRSKTELVNILWAKGGMRHFSRDCTRLYLDRCIDPVPLGTGEANARYERFAYCLLFIKLGNETWAYVQCNGVVVVPPFEFIGWEYLPSHPW